MRGGAAIVETSDPFLAIAPEPLVDRPDAHAERLGHIFDPFPPLEPPHDLSATPRGRFRVRMELHPGALL
jgi:hypothetical protein